MMPIKASARAHASQALIPFHGYSDEGRRVLPVDTVFCSLTGLYSTTTVEFTPGSSERSVEINDLRPSPPEYERVVNFVTQLGSLYALPRGFRLVSKNTFPSRCGLGSSGSSFASIARAVGHIVGEVDECTLSKLSRLGSISAACSSIGGVSLLLADPVRPWATPVLPAEEVPLVACVVVVAANRDTVSKHRQARSSPFYEVIAGMAAPSASRMMEALATRDFDGIAEIATRQLAYNVALLATATEEPTLAHWSPEGLAAAGVVQAYRNTEQVPAFVAMNSGPSVFCYAPYGKIEPLVTMLRSRGLPFLQVVAATRAKVLDQHLF